MEQQQKIDPGLFTILYLQTNFCLKTKFPGVTYGTQVVKLQHQTLQGKLVELVVKQALTSPTEHRSWECKFNIKESDGNMFYPIY